VLVPELSTPALLIDADALEHNLVTMADRLPGTRLRPHVKAHKCTALARSQFRHGHTGFTCATVREMLVLAEAGLGDDLLLANEVLDPARLTALAAAQEDAFVTIAVDSEATIDAAATAGLRHVVIDVNVGLPRCGCAPDDAGRLADLARRRGLDVRGVMGYEGHLMMADPTTKAAEVRSAMDLLAAAHALVGGDIVSAGGTGTHDLFDGTAVTEVQAGSYALMDTQYTTLGHGFRLATTILGTVIAATPTHLVADVGLKALGMDHGLPAIDGARVWFCSDEHITFSPDPEQDGHQAVAEMTVGDRVRVVPAHIDPTMALHEAAWVVLGDTIVDRWDVDMRGW
jgi:D-serine deaminase-like pyridoxal phosphate-dependent protein